MKIAIVVERFGRQSGGAETAAWELARELVRRDLRVTAVCREAEGEAPPGVLVNRLGTPRFWQPLRITAFSRAAAKATARGFDVVHAFSRTRHQHVYRAGGGSHAAYIERVYGRPRLHRMSPRHLAILRIEEAVFGDPGQIIQCNARRCAEEIGRRYAIGEERIAVIYNGVDTERFHPRQRRRRDELRSKLELNGPVALFVGSGFRRKGLDRAIEGLARSGAEVTLLVAGADDTGAWRRQARSLGVEKRVRFAGRRDDVEALHGASDLFVLPTRYDPFSNACLEAMASGLPVVTTPQNGAAEVIRDGENGWVLEEDFAPAFERLADLGALERVGAGARATAEEHTWERHAREIVDLYARIKR